MRHIEDTLAVSVAQFLQAAAPDLLWWHVPNGGKRNKREAARFKLMGVRAGVPDLQVILANGSAAFIELKAPKKYLSKAQKVFRQQAEARGCAYVVCRSLDDVRVTLAEWGVPLRIADSRTIAGRAA